MESGHGQALLTALAEFIRPLKHDKYAIPSRLITHPKLSADSNQANLYLDTTLANQPERKALGQELLICLEKFIAATVSPKLHSDDARIYDEKQGTDALDDRNRSDEDAADDANIQSNSAMVVLTDGKERQMYDIEVIGGGAKTPSVPQLFGNDELPSKVLEILRRHIFNKMPIRLLAFDSNGSGMQLIERNEIFYRLLQTMQARFIQPSFQTELDKFRITTHYTIWEAEETRYFTRFVEQHGRYAILSHTWIRDTPGDVVYTKWRTREQNKQGYAKIANFCRVAARHHGLRFGWMDTICINKDSSSELDESIRSMYKWYRLAQVCIIYLANTVNFHQIHNDPWFTRGWTLQELLAPKDIRFYGTDWTELIANPEDVQWEIQLATTITALEMNTSNQGRASDIPISRIMQLAANRTVTREEDTSYSLMGLLGVDIPIAYGEGSERALFRLIRETLNTKKDVLDVFNHSYYPFNRLIPSTIKQFLLRSSAFDVRDCSQRSPLNNWSPLEPIMLTHLGVRISLLMIPAALRPTGEPYYSIHRSFNGYFSLSAHSNWGADKSGTNYVLLHPSCFETEYNDDNASHPRRIITVGVLNFGVHDDQVFLPTQCLFVPLDHDVVKTGKFPETVKILPTRTRVVFQLETKDNSVSRTVPRGELEAHGMRIRSIYLE